MSKYKCISDELENRLNSLKKNESMHVLVIEKSKKDLKSLTDYLVDKRKDFETVTTLNTVDLLLTKKEIYSVAKHDYVAAILENQRIYPKF